LPLTHAGFARDGALPALRGSMPPLRRSLQCRDRLNDSPRSHAMNLRTLTFFLAAFAASTAAMPQAAPSPSAAASMPMDSMKGMPGHHDMKQSMAKGMRAMQNMPMTGDIDKDFAMMMKVHHQQALDMAQMELEQGKSAEMKAMAAQIVKAQKKEIAQFDRWLARQK
jgi:uncharacterized protein (DUF305 family)